jgi:hypothetical protein
MAPPPSRSAREWDYQAQEFLRLLKEAKLQPAHLLQIHAAPGEDSLRGVASDTRSNDRRGAGQGRAQQHYGDVAAVHRPALDDGNRTRGGGCSRKSPARLMTANGNSATLNSSRTISR